MGTRFLLLAFLLIASPSLSLGREADNRSPFWLEGELQGIWQGRNDIQIPSDSGTRFALDELENGPFASGRIYAGYRFHPKHEVRALYAPLTLKLQGNLPQTVNFQNRIFPGNTPTEATYKFHSYRLTYRYVFPDSGPWTIRLGFTGKIRDAEIRLVQAGGLNAARTNTGFVPLLHFSGRYLLSPLWRLHWDIDGLAAPQGRAIDGGFFIGHRAFQNSEIKIGYRTLEGGTSGGGGVYNFSWLHFAVLGLETSF